MSQDDIENDELNDLVARLHAAEEEREELVRTRAEADARCLTLQAELDRLREEA